VRLLEEALRSDWHWKWLFCSMVRLALQLEWLEIEASSFKLQEAKLSETTVNLALHSLWPATEALRLTSQEALLLSEALS
jgi:hypothetical protein